MTVIQLVSFSQEIKKGTLTVRKYDFVTHTQETNVNTDTVYYDTIDEKKMIVHGNGTINENSAYFTKGLMFLFDGNLKGRLDRLSKKEKREKKFLKLLARKKRKEKIDYQAYKINVSLRNIMVTNFIQTSPNVITYTVDTISGDTVDFKLVKGTMRAIQPQIDAKYLYFTVTSSDSTYEFTTSPSRRMIFDRTLRTINFAIDSVNDICASIDFYVSQKQDNGIYRLSNRIFDKKWEINFKSIDLFKNQFYLNDGLNDLVVNYRTADDKIITLSDNPLFKEAQIKRGKIQFKLDKKRYTFRKVG